MKKTEKTRISKPRTLIPGKLSKCYYCDPDNSRCTKYEKSKWDLGDYTWNNYCLRDGGCDR